MNFLKSELMRFVNMVLLILMPNFCAIFYVVGFEASMDFGATAQGPNHLWGKAPIPLKSNSGGLGASHQSF